MNHMLNYKFFDFEYKIMSFPIIQLGQCGNQIGANFYDIMYDQGTRASPGHQAMLQTFFYPSQTKPWRAKAFQIDMQPKVVMKNLNTPRNWAYNKKLSFVQQDGSGNNWAYGCNIHGNKNKTEIQNLFRMFIEEQDYIKGFLQIQSMAGGTGSGLGTFISIMLNDLFPKTPKFAVCVMPHLSGQVILQSYNASLSVGTMYQNTDGIFVVENDEIDSICNKELKIKKISLQDINQVIGRNLASVFFPAINKSTQKVFSIEQNEFNYGLDLMETIFSDNRYKLASIKTSPNGPKNSEAFNYDSWQAIENDLTYKKFNKVKSRLMIVRGPDHPKTLSTQNVRTIFDKHTFYKYNRSIVLVENSNKFNPAFQQILNRAYTMFNNNAYLYQYYKYGLEKDKFLECFGTIQNVIANYSKL